MKMFLKNGNRVLEGELVSTGAPHGGRSTALLGVVATALRLLLNFHGSKMMILEQVRARRMQSRQLEDGEVTRQCCSRSVSKGERWGHARMVTRRVYFLGGSRFSCIEARKQHLSVE